MKFPRKLSKERLSLLSPEDRKIYEYEHSGLCPEMKLLYESNTKVEEPEEDDITFEDIRDYELSNEYTEEEKREIKRIFDEMLFESQFDELFDKELIEELGIDEYNNVKKSIFEYIINDPDLNTLNEAEGHAADWWMDCSWIVKLGAGLLTGLLGVVAWLLMKGKDRLALMKLKQYMNKLVELTDLGVNKKRPWYSFLMPSRKAKLNTGDYNKACFRTILETAERNMACLYTLAIHSLGFLSPELSNFDEITSGYLPAEGSGLSNFNDIASKKGNDAESLYTDNSDLKLVPVHINKEYYQNLKLPALPTNYSMLMSNIDYPTKANTNPNGSLFMKPTLEILQAKAEDIGLVYFTEGEVTVDSIINKSTNINLKNKNESLFYTRNSVLNALLEVEAEDGLDKLSGPSDGGLLTGDLDTTNVAGAELDLETKKKEETSVKEFKGNLIDAIDGYVSSSIPIITKLTRSICGKSTSSEISKFALLVSTLNNASEGNMTKYMKKYDTVLHDVMDNDYSQKLLDYQTSVTIAARIVDIIRWIGSNEFCKQVGLSDDKKKDYLKELTKLSKQSKITEKELEIVNKEFTAFDAYNKFESIAKNIKELKIGESLSYIYYSDVYLAQQLFEDELIKEGPEILKALNDAMEAGYNEVRHKLNENLLGIVENDPADWYVIQNARERMKKLKEAADKEITAKIDLICRTASTAQSSLGDKFKSALSKHPVRAEGLKNIWARYADDLDDRIESRIRSITGDNGNSNIVTTIKLFLTVTYPNLIALMLYYKSIFYLIKLYTDKYPVSEKSADTLHKQLESSEKIHLKAELEKLVVLNP